MSAENDLIKLYSGRILALASNIPRIGKLSAPNGSARHRSPLCGSTVAVDVLVTNGKIEDFAQDVKACALGQAAASVVGAAVVGLTRADILKARDELAAMLRDNGPAPSPPFQDLKVLEPAKEFTNRHDSILLTLNALLEAIDEALGQKKPPHPI